MANNTSQHIMGTSANLLGFCLFVITSFHITNNAAGSIIDEVTAIVAVMLSVSCFFSFISIRTSDFKKEERLEKIADYFFIGALSGILFIVILITLNIIK